MVVSPLWLGPGNIHGFVLGGKPYRCSNTSCESNTVNLMRMQPHYYRVRRVEPCQRICEVGKHISQAIVLSALRLNNNNNSFNLRQVYNVMKYVG